VKIAQRNFPIEDHSDYVTSSRSDVPVYKKMGISLYLMRYREEWGKFKGGYFVVNEGSKETYHSEDSSPFKALSSALQAWKRRRSLIKDQEDLVAILDGSKYGFCPLVTLRDSWDAGNCETGTRAWIEQKGITRKLVPGIILLDYLEENLVLNVAKQVCKRVEQEVALQE